MGRRESPLEATAVKWARARNIVVAKLTEVVGIPDRIFFVPGGRPVVIEFKAAKKKPAALQAYYLETLKAAGYYAAYCDTKEKFLALMETYGVT
jgi:hypothetical protein